MERKELLEKNSQIFVEQGKALEQLADRNVKCVIIANPANTNALILKTNAPSIPAENFSCLMRLDQNRSIDKVAAKLGVTHSKIKDVIVWGNHSATQFPDTTFATVDGKSVHEVGDKEYF